MVGEWGRAHGARVIAIAVACALPVSGCSIFSAATPTETASVTTSVTPSPSITPSASPSASPSPSPSPSPSVSVTAEPSGPIVGKPAGSPVKPEIFLATVDTTAGVLRVVVDVPNIYEDGGLCTTRVTAGTTRLQAHNTGAANATSTACGQFTFDLADLPSGSATIVASYQSSKYSGDSDPEKVTIP
jgi:hypothetical protein